MAPVTIILPAMLDMQSCSQLYQDLTEGLSVQQQIVLDASGIERITTPAIQLILAAAVTAQSKAKQVMISRPASVFMLAMEDLGLTPLLTPYIATGENAL